MQIYKEKYIYIKHNFLKLYSLLNLEIPDTNIEMRTYYSIKCIEIFHI